MPNQQPTKPLKSIAITLLFAVFLGPVGLLYASLTGGIIMIILGFIVVSVKYIVPIVLVWLISCIWSVAAANRYNNKILEYNYEKNNPPYHDRDGNYTA